MQSVSVITPNVYMKLALWQGNQLMQQLRRRFVKQLYQAYVSSWERNMQTEKTERIRALHEQASTQLSSAWEARIKSFIKGVVSSYLATALHTCVVAWRQHAVDANQLVLKQQRAFLLVRRAVCSMQDRLENNCVAASVHSWHWNCVDLALARSKQGCQRMQQQQREYCMRMVAGRLRALAHNKATVSALQRWRGNHQIETSQRHMRDIAERDHQANLELSKRDHFESCVAELQSELAGMLQTNVELQEANREVSRVTTTTQIRWVRSVSFRTQHVALSTSVGCWLKSTA